MKVKFNLEVGNTVLSEIREYDEEECTMKEIEEDLNAWVDSEVDRWMEQI